MVGSNGTMIAIRLVRSKLRKREEHSNSVHPAEVVLQTAGNPTALAPIATQQSPMQPPQPLPPDPIAYSGQFFWQSPVPQPHIVYSNDQVNTNLCLFHTHTFLDKKMHATKNAVSNKR